MQGSIISAIGRGINAIISAIVNVLMTIVSVITTVRALHLTRRMAVLTLFTIDSCNNI